jgi:hypothetical protein
MQQKRRLKNLKTNLIMKTLRRMKRKRKKTKRIKRMKKKTRTLFLRKFRQKLRVIN